MDYARLSLLFCLMLSCFTGHTQEILQYDRFHLEEGELYWQHTYECRGNQDSIRQAVEHMLKARTFTFHVVRSKDAFSGKLSHYTVNAKNYGRTYLNTPKAYWDGEWSGKFTVEARDHHYTVTVYALQYKSETQSVGHYKPEKIRTGQYIDDVTVHNRQGLLNSEFSNLSLMSLSLKDNFDLNK